MNTTEEILKNDIEILLTPFLPGSNWNKHLNFSGMLMHDVFSILKNTGLTDKEKLERIKNKANECLIDFYLNVDKMEKESIDAEIFKGMYLIKS